MGINYYTASHLCTVINSVQMLVMLPINSSTNSHSYSNYVSSSYTIDSFYDFTSYILFKQMLNNSSVLIKGCLIRIRASAISSEIMAAL